MKKGDLVRLKTGHAGIGLVTESESWTDSVTYQVIVAWPSMRPATFEKSHYNWQLEVVNESR